MSRGVKEEFAALDSAEDFWSVDGLTAAKSQDNPDQLAFDFGPIDDGFEIVYEGVGKFGDPWLHISYPKPRDSKAGRPKSKGAAKKTRKPRRGGVHKSRLTLSPKLHAEFTHDLDAALTRIEADTSVSEPGRMKARYLLEEYLSKYVDPESISGPDERKLAAITKWRSAELRNSATNRRLQMSYAQFTLNGGRSVWSSDILQTARETITRVIGEHPTLEVLYGTFTSGASTQFSRGPGVLERKFMDESHVTPQGLPWACALFSMCPGWEKIVSESRENIISRIQLQTGNVMFTVPKTAEIDRCAAKEPGINMLMQKGVGAFFRRRLESWGQDLNDQTVNQRLAREGSIGRKLATLDLSMASDLISHQLVFNLLPFAWYDLLDDIRSPYCNVEGELVEVDMFSSMGNAFTFELESLIFWALVKAIALHAEISGPISVYGDDIICPAEVAPLVGRIFHFFGFLVNPRKSFWKGPFRESCGKHYYAGVDVTPFYIREPIRSVPRLIHALNRLRQWSSADGVLDDALFPIWEKYAKRVPREWRGGKDLDSIESLVTDESPVARLVRVKNPVSLDVTGAYLHWLRAADCETPPVKGRVWKDNVRVERVPEKGLVIDVREALICSRAEVDTDLYRSIKISRSERHNPRIQPGYIPGWP